MECQFKAHSMDRPWSPIKQKVMPKERKPKKLWVRNKALVRKHIVAITKKIPEHEFHLQI